MLLETAVRLDCQFAVFVSERQVEALLWFGFKPSQHQKHHKAAHLLLPAPPAGGMARRKYKEKLLG